MPFARGWRASAQGFGNHQGQMLSLLPAQGAVGLINSTLCLRATHAPADPAPGSWAAGVPYLCSSWGNHP